MTIGGSRLVGFSRRGLLLMGLLLNPFYWGSNAVRIGVLVGDDSQSSILRHKIDEAISSANEDLSGENRMDLIVSTAASGDTFNVTNSACSQLSEGAVVLLSPQSGTAHDALISLSNKFNVPYISATSSRTTATAAKFSVRIRPPSYQAVADVFTANGWHDLVYIYDAEDGLDELQSILAAFPKDYAIQVKYVHRHTANKSGMDFLQERENDSWDEEKHIILQVELSVAKLIVQHAFVKKRAYYHFVVASYSTPELWRDVRTYDQTTITAFQILQTQQYNRQRTTVSNQRNQNDEIIKEKDILLWDGATLLQATLNQLSREQPQVSREVFQRNVSPTVQCYTSNNQPYRHGATIMEIMKKAAPEGITGQLRFDATGIRTGYTIEILEMTSQTDMQRTGQWTPEQRLRFDNPDQRNVDRERVKTYSSKTFVITTIIEPPFLSFLTPNDTRPDIHNVQGYLKDLIERLMQTANLPHYSIHFVKDGKYGARDKTALSGWNGMIGEILRKDADIAIAPLSITADRSRVVHFTEPFLTSGYSLVAQRPAFNWMDIFTPFTFLQPLHWQIWLCLVGAYLAVAFVLLLVNRINLAVATPPNVPPSACRHLYNSIWYSFGAFMSEECNNCKPKSLGSRIISCAWWFFILIVLSTYTAQLWIHKPYKDVADGMPTCARELAYQSEYKYGTVRGSSIQDFFKHSKDDDFMRAWAQMQSFNMSLYKTFEEALQRVRNDSKYILAMDSRKAAYVNAHKPCSTMTVSKEFVTGGFGIAMSPKFPMRNKIDAALSQLRDDDFLTRMEEKWFKTPSTCPPDTTGVKPLDIFRVLGWFIILAIGLLIAIIVAITEIYCKRPKKPKNKEAEAAKKAEKKTKKKKGDKKKNPEEIETQQLTAHEAPMEGGEPYSDGQGEAYDPEADTPPRRGMPREKKIDDDYNDDGPPVPQKVPMAEVENLTDTESRDLMSTGRGLPPPPMMQPTLRLDGQGLKSIDHSPIESPPSGLPPPIPTSSVPGYENSEV